MAYTLKDKKENKKKKKKKNQLILICFYDLIYFFFFLVFFLFIEESILSSLPLSASLFFSNYKYYAMYNKPYFEKVKY